MVTDFECALCKQAGRKHRHDPRKCKFAPGGEWYGKSKDELRALQKQYYEKINQTRQGKSLTHQVVQRKRRRKLGRDKAGNDSSPGSIAEPLWRKETTMIAMQDDPSSSNNMAIPVTPTSNNSEIRNITPSPEVENTPGVSEGDSPNASSSDSEMECEAPIGPEAPTPSNSPEV